RARRDRGRSRGDPRRRGGDRLPPGGRARGPRAWRRGPDPADLRAAPSPWRVRFRALPDPLAGARSGLRPRVPARLPPSAAARDHLPAPEARRVVPALHADPRARRRERPRPASRRSGLARVVRRGVPRIVEVEPLIRMLETRLLEPLHPGPREL